MVKVEDGFIPSKVVRWTVVLAISIFTIQTADAKRKPSDYVVLLPKQRASLKTKTATQLPDIPYNRKDLQELIDEMPMAPGVRDKVANYLVSIEEHVLDIKRYQDKAKSEDFYEKMKEALIKIHNLTLEAYGLAKPDDSVLANKLRKLILSCIEPFENELHKRIEMSKADRDKLERKTMNLYAQQSFIVRQNHLKTPLMEHLAKLKQLLTEDGKAGPRCYISYAWPSAENTDEEYWVQPFLYILYDHLKAAGISIVMDVRDSQPGDSIFQFMRQYKDGNHIISVGTESLLQKHYGPANNAVKTELSIIYNKFEQDYKQFGYGRIYPLLISGSANTAFPEMYDKFHAIVEGRDEGYLVLIERLIQWLYKEQLNKNKIAEQEYISLWHKFHEFYKDNNGLPINADAEQVTNELELGYHRQRLDYLRQDLPADEETRAPERPRLVWNLPRQDHKFIGREGLLEELEAKLDPQTKMKDKTSELFAVSVCAGLGGVGKTQLALQYIHHAKHPYTLKAWFQAENLNQLKQQYIEFAGELGYRDREPSFERALPYVKEWLAKRPGWLLVYDNVNSYEEVKAFLPNNGGSIILTTRWQKWPGKFETLDINVMAEQEAIDLVQSLIQYKINVSEQASLKELVKILGYLPLALAQAGAYIKQSSTSITDYLRIYKEHEQEIIKDDALPEGGNSLPIATTWNISLEAIAKEAKAKNQPPFALHLLSACAYLAPEKISHKLLLTWLKQSYPKLPNPELVLPKIIGQLWQYSMLSKDEGGDITIHRLVQAVVRYQHKQASNNGLFRKIKTYYPTPKWFNILIKSAHIEFTKKTKILEDEQRQKNLLPHMQSLLHHYKQMWPNATELNIVPILNDIGSVNSLIGEHRIAKFYYERILPTLNQHYGNDHIELSYIFDHIGRELRYLGDVKQAKMLHERSLIIKEEHYGKNHVEVATTLDHLGRDCRYLGDVKQAKMLHERSLIIKEEHYGKNHVEVAHTLDQLGRNYRYLGDVKQSKMLHERSLIIKEKHYGIDHIETALTIDYLGRSYRYLGDVKQAKTLHECVLTIREAHYGKDNVELAHTLDQLGRDHWALGDVKLAKELQERSTKNKETYYGKNHIEVALTLEHLGKSYRDFGHVKQAKDIHVRTLRIKEAYYGKYDPEVAVSLVQLGIDCRELGDVKQAKEFHERAMKINELFYGNEQIAGAQAIDQLGIDYRKLGNPKQAKELHEKALKIKTQYYNDSHISTAETYTNLGSAYMGLKNIKQGKIYLEQALNIKESYYGVNNLLLIETLMELGNAHKHLKNSKEAKIYFDRALKIRQEYFGLDHLLVKELEKLIVKINK